MQGSAGSMRLGGHHHTSAGCSALHVLLRQTFCLPKPLSCVQPVAGRKPEMKHFSVAYMKRYLKNKILQRLLMFLKSSEISKEVCYSFLSFCSSTDVLFTERGDVRSVGKAHTRSWQPQSLQQWSEYCKGLLPSLSVQQGTCLPCPWVSGGAASLLSALWGLGLDPGAMKANPSL